MKQLKVITLIVLMTIVWIISANAQDNQESPKLSDEQKRFDLNGDGKLSDEENELRLRVTGLEAFTGDKLTREEIEEIERTQRSIPTAVSVECRHLVVDVADAVVHDHRKKWLSSSIRIKTGN